VSDFESIYQQYGKTVYFFLLSLTQNESLSEELTQETMCRAIMNIGAFRGESKMSVWLCQIAKNLYFEWQKKNKRNVPIEDALLAEPDGLDIEEELTRKETAHRILKHLHTLDDPYKEVFMLHALGERKLKWFENLAPGVIEFAKNCDLNLRMRLTGDCCGSILFETSYFELTAHDDEVIRKFWLYLCQRGQLTITHTEETFRMEFLFALYDKE